jgi:acetylornithine deacetylase/succinyl-diaminopimelate desuccinylase-like protein
VESEDGKPVALNVELTEKTYADYQLTVTSLGGHSSLPSRHGNAIRVLADALGRVEGHQFPFELNDVTLEYIEQRSRAEIGQRAADLRAVLSPSPDPKALARISDDPFLNATVRTTCVPTRVNGGQANNALPQKAEAIVNCRILPGHSPEEVRQVLLNIIEDPTVAVHWMAASRDVFDRAPAECGPPPAKPNAAVMNAVKNVVAEMWPGIPTWAMQETGASDGRFTNLAGIPTYGVSGVAIDRDDMRMHGPDERLRITSFYDGLDYYRRLLKKLTSPPGTVSGQGKQSR